MLNIPNLTCTHTKKINTHACTHTETDSNPFTVSLNRNFIIHDNRADHPQKQLHEADKGSQEPFQSIQSHQQSVNSNLDSHTSSTVNPSDSGQGRAPRVMSRHLEHDIHMVPFSQGGGPFNTTNPSGAMISEPRSSHGDDSKLSHSMDTVSSKDKGQSFVLRLQKLVKDADKISGTADVAIDTCTTESFATKPRDYMTVMSGYWDCRE